VLGTAAYLSPEQARGEQAGPASDLYALGVVSYQLLANRLPYDAASLTDLARLQEAGPPPRLNELNPDVSPALAEAIMVALHRDPEQRYADAADMEQALNDALAGRGPVTEATWAAEDTEATRMLAGTQATSALPRERPSRRLEPIVEEPRRRTTAPPPARRARRAPEPKPKSGGAGKWIALLLVLAVVGGGIFAYQKMSDNAARGVQLKQDVSGRVDDAVDQLKQLIEDNTR
jgi:serine/threonine-protein kinase